MVSERIGYVAKKPDGMDDSLSEGASALCLACGDALSMGNGRRSYSPMFAGNRTLMKDGWVAVMPHCLPCMRVEFERMKAVMGAGAALSCFSVRYDIPLFEQYTKITKLDAWLDAVEGTCGALAPIGFLDGDEKTPDAKRMRELIEKLNPSLRNSKAKSRKFYVPSANTART